MIKKYKSVIAAVLATLFVIISLQLMFFGKYLKPILKLNQVMNLLDDKFYFNADKMLLTDYALAGMTIATNDPYTNYYNKEQFASYLNSGENSYIGIGVILSPTEDNKHLQVISAMEGSPGEKAGILSGDIIVEVNGEAVTADDLSAVAEKLRGKEKDIGVVVNLKVSRNAEETLDIAVEKSPILKDTVRSKVIDNGIGYIRINAFDRQDSSNRNSTDTFDEFKSEIDLLQSQGINKLILDVRDNPGGDVKVVSRIVDYLLPEGVIAYTEDKHGKKDYIYSDKNYIDMKIVVLANGGSASASEILTGALKDRQRAFVVGTKTYGKGIVQTIFPLSDGSGISITTSKYYLPNGACIHGIGIEPDFVVTLPEDINKPTSLLTDEEDTQLQKAIEVIGW